MKCWPAILPALILALLILAPQALAAEPQAFFGAEAPIIMGSPDTAWPPYYCQDAGLGLPGILPEVFREATRAMGIRTKLRFLPEKRAMLALGAGRIDVFTKAKEWVEDPSKFLWSTPVTQSTDVLMFRAGEEFAFQKPEDLEGKVVGTVLGYRYPTLEPLFASGAAKREDAPCARKQLRMLRAGRCDAAITNRHVALWLISRNPDLEAHWFSFSQTPVASAGYRFVFSRHRTWGRFIEELDREIQRMRDDGRLEAVLKRYR